MERGLDGGIGGITIDSAYDPQEDADSDGCEPSLALI
jgi:hypothetical protein